MRQLTINPAGPWRLYSPALPAGAEPLGTVTRNGHDTGALVRFVATGVFAQVNAGVVRTLDQRLAHHVARLLAEGGA